MESGTPSTPKFFGHHELTIDEKGRVSIPSAWRQLIPTVNDRQRVIIKRGGKSGAKAAQVIPLETYLKRSAVVTDEIELSEEEEAKQRRVFGAVWELDLDKAGRIVLPESVRRFFGLQGEVTLSGRGQHMEFWDRKAWDEFLDNEMK